MMKRRCERLKLYHSICVEYSLSLYFNTAATIRQKERQASQAAMFIATLLMSAVCHCRFAAFFKQELMASRAYHEKWRA